MEISRVVGSIPGWKDVIDIYTAGRKMVINREIYLITVITCQ